MPTSFSGPIFFRDTRLTDSFIYFSVFICACSADGSSCSGRRSLAFRRPECVEVDWFRGRRPVHSVPSFSHPPHRPRNVRRRRIYGRLRRCCNRAAPCTHRCKSHCAQAILAGGLRARPQLGMSQFLLIDVKKTLLRFFIFVTFNVFNVFFILTEFGAVVRALDLRLKGRGFKSQPLQCRVQLWTSCSQTLSSSSGVTTLWRYINQFN